VKKLKWVVFRATPFSPADSIPGNAAAKPGRIGRREKIIHLGGPDNEIRNPDRGKPDAGRDFGFPGLPRNRAKGQ